jgi:hypothetical protein
MKIPVLLLFTVLAAPTTGETIRGLGIGFETPSPTVAAPTDAPVPTETAPTDAPEPAPTDAPIEPTDAPEAGEVVLVTVDIVFDGFAPEIGWWITDDSGETIVNVTVGTYPPLTVSTSEPVELISGANYTFTIVDLFGDGLSNPEDGFYTVTQGEETLVSGFGNFGYDESYEFETL